MNCPSRTDEPPRSDGHNQSPNPLSNDLTTNQDLNGMANARRLRRTAALPLQSAGLDDDADSATGAHMDSTDEDVGRPAGDVASGRRMPEAATPAPALASPLTGSSSEKGPARSRVRVEGGLDTGGGGGEEGGGRREGGEEGGGEEGGGEEEEEEGGGLGQGGQRAQTIYHGMAGYLRRVGKTLKTFYHFVGPGFIVAVAYSTFHHVLSLFSFPFPFH